MGSINTHSLDDARAHHDKRSFATPADEVVRGARRAIIRSGSTVVKTAGEVVVGWYEAVSAGVRAATLASTARKDGGVE